MSGTSDNKTQVSDYPNETGGTDDLSEGDHSRSSPTKQIEPQEEDLKLYSRARPYRIVTRASVLQ